MTAADFRRMALKLEGATDGSHFGQADFRVGGKIFATLAYEKQGYGVLLLSPDQQAGMVEDAPEVFAPVKGGWGKQGATRVHLASVAADILQAALRTAWLTRKAKDARPRKKAATAAPRAKKANRAVSGSEASLWGLKCISGRVIPNRQRR